MAGVLIVFLYVQGLDLGVGEAGTVLVGGEGRSTGETCLPGWGWVQRSTYSSGSRGGSPSGRDRSEKQASGGVDCEGIYRVFDSEWEKLG